MPSTKTDPLADDFNRTLPGDSEREARAMQQDNENGKGVSGSYVSDDAELQAALRRPPARAWIPREGDNLAGCVIDRYTAESEYGEYEVLEVEVNEDTVISVHGFHETLATAIRRRNPQPGDGVAIAYHGLVPSKVRGHNPYQNFTLFVKRHA